MNLNTPLYSSGGSPMAFSVFNDAFAIYGSVDYLGTGNDILRMFVYSASPQERDFTETELTDGTFSTWAGASVNYARVTKLYNQLGDSDLDLATPTSSKQFFYNPTDNEIRSDSSGYYQYTTLFTMASGASTKLANAFENNTTDTDTTFVLGARKRDNNMSGLPQSGRTMFALRDNVSPVGANLAKHKAVKIKNSMLTDDIGVSARGDDFTTVEFFHDVFDHSTLKTYIFEIERIPAEATTVTDMNMFINGTQVLDEQTTNLDADIDIGRLEIGDNRFVFKGAILFNKILTANEKSLVHTRMSEDY